jgi:UDP-N-acetylmuramate dehydrogenase
MGAGKSYLWAREIAANLPVKFSDLTSFKIGGKIKKYFEVKNREEVIESVKYAKENKLPVFIIGDGTDILASDDDFNGVVIKYVGKSYKLQNLNSEFAEVTAEAGMNWDKLVEFTVQNELQGIESLSGIPGTVGASPVQNIGAYGSELMDNFVELEAYDIENGKFVTFSKEDCKFGYRESVFKQKKYWQKFIVVSVTFKLNKNIVGTANYESLKKYISFEKATIKEIRDAVLKVRSEKLENPDEVGNAGSFFKNPIVDLKKKTELEGKYSDIKIFPFENNFKIPAGWLIEQTGWKGKTYKSAGVSKKHSLVLVNENGHATAADVYDLSEKIISDVYNKFGVKLEREVQLINF